MNYLIYYFLQSLSTEDYRNVMKTVENAIISTDLAMYFKKKVSFKQLVDEGEFDWQSEGKKECKLCYRSLILKLFGISVSTEHVI